MGLLLLLTSMLLSSCRTADLSSPSLGKVVNEESRFTLKDITLSIEPSTDVTRDINVTLRCKAIIASQGPESLSRVYTIYKDGNKIYTKNSNTSEDLLYPLPEARVSNNGKYTCQINILDKEMTSKAKKLTVTGLSKPVLQLNNGVVREGEELTARCTAPGETGSIFFYFYDDSEEILSRQVTSDHAEGKFHMNSVGIHKIHCAYTVLIMPDSFKSEKSNNVTVSVKELSVAPVLEIFPQHKIYEGDQLNILCTIINSLHSFKSMQLDLTQGAKLLSRGDTKVNISMVAVAKDLGEFECRLEIGNVVKIAKKAVSVTELFSVPTLTMSPAEVFQKESMTLTCKSKSYASERLRVEELTYTLDPPESPLTPKDIGVFSGKALQYDFNYTCIAEAHGIKKHSETLTVRPKVAVSTPNISVVGRAILGQPFKILCQSDTGSLPINYTLLRDDNPNGTTSVKQLSEKALFTVTITKPNEIGKYRCKAKNSHKEVPPSESLNAPVIEPLTHPRLTVIPDLPEIFEEVELLLICGINGTPPVTFKWYRVGTEQPLHTTTSNTDSNSYKIHSLSKEHSGRYFCEAVNHANNVIRSEPVNIEVHLALWKRAVIGGFCLLAVSVLVVVCVLYFRSKRVRVDRAAVSVWSKRPPEAANDEESSVVSSEPDVEYTEVVHPQPVDPARVPLRKGTDTVYSELQNSPHGAADHHDYGSVEYAELKCEQPDINHYGPEVNSYQDLPVPVD